MNLTQFLFILLSISLCEGCVFDVTKLSPQPLTLNVNYKYIHPASHNDSSVDINPGEKILVSCPGTDFVNFPETSTLYLVCNERDEFELEGIGLEINYFQLSCTTDVVSSIQYTNRTCWENAEIIRMGYQVDSVFVSVMDVCFDMELKSGLYSNYSMTTSAQPMEDIESPFIIADDIFDSLFYTMEYIYANGQGPLNSLVGLAYDSDYYYSDSSMDATPLGSSPIRDLFYITEIRAVNRYINMWPRWSRLINWIGLTIISYICFSEVEQLDLQVYVGTFGVVALDHVFTGEKIEIYLHTHDFVKAIPLPAVIWKLLYHQETKRAVVLLTVNTPYNYEDYVFCDNILYTLPWLTCYVDPPSYWSILWDNVNRGYTYACDYPALKGVIPYLPELDVVDVLK